MFKVFSRPQIDLEDIMKFEKVAAYVAENDLDQEILEQAEIQVKYSGYIEKERNNADKLLRLEDVKYLRILIMKKSSIEAKQKLSKIRPVTILKHQESVAFHQVMFLLLIYMGR
jgi:tRNA uridine 5-carboxymethylaminomethyl modification enzyme